MGDLNDDPVDLSVLEHLKAKGNQELLKEGDLFNPMFQLHADSLGTLSYRKKWNSTTQRFMDQPVHDIHSESADAFRQFGQMNIGGDLNGNKPQSIDFNSEW